MGMIGSEFKKGGCVGERLGRSEKVVDVPRRDWERVEKRWRCP